jgi:hypothetical protein
VMVKVATEKTVHTKKLAHCVPKTSLLQQKRRSVSVVFAGHRPSLQPKRVLPTGNRKGILGGHGLDKPA